MSGAVATEDVTQLPELPLARRCPYQPPEGYRELRERGTVTRARLYDGRPVWVVTGYAATRTILASPDTSVDVRQPNMPLPVPGMAGLRQSGSATIEALLRTDPPAHSRQRRAVLPSLTFKRISAWEPEIVRCTDAYLDRMLAESPPVDLLDVFAKPLVAEVLGRLLGVPEADVEHFQTLTYKRFNPVRSMTGYLTHLLTDGRDDLRDGQLRDLVERIDEGELTVEEAAGLGIAIVLAGQDITVNTLGMSVLTLLAERTQLDLLRAEPERWPDAVEELLRYLSLTGATVRVATADLEVDGELIRAGEGIVLLLPAANRDAERFAHPDVLDVRRAARGHLTFGFGVHQCVGQHLGRLELLIALRALFTRIPGLHVAVPVEQIPVKQGVVFGLGRLPVRW
ncbi:cytochrome P450 [Micromonospora craniellae]|uniref:Cytochrome P450 n=1 Tax=Micromonospora craniellae TaxID=2294034 RepID=A0A372FV01_9ACTN|nr:cytochrome P450 [Micromonospora craniellae]QOC89752.1 cytochrome P450 [Micromonospora craniellae]RFS44528.1 cytochrome P450 [Micromonospora craniellae]